MLLASDGFGNAQAADPWQQPVGADLVTFAQERGVAWMRQQVPLWAKLCASAEGSGDDTALALLLSGDLPETPTVPIPEVPAAPGGEPPTAPIGDPGVSQR